MSKVGDRIVNTTTKGCLRMVNTKGSSRWVVG